MKREKQIELMDSAESRTSEILRNWLANPAVRAALKKRPKKADDQVDEHYHVRVRRKAAC